MSMSSRVFKNGNSRAVRLPKELAFPDHVQEVTITREGNRMIIEPVPPRSSSDLSWKNLGLWPDFERPPQVAKRRSPFSS
jgi:antitoxin VapB